MMMTHPVPAPRTPKGREVARSTLEAASVAENKHDLSRLERILMASRNEDLNLTALINAVERDIWYMEQLESNPSVLRRKDSPQELPFPITDELLRLPGYKPRLRNSKSPSPEIHRMEPPLLPPKQRQRRHSDTVTSLTDASFLMQHQNSCSRSLTRKNSLQANAVLESMHPQQRAASPTSLVRSTPFESLDVESSSCSTDGNSSFDNENSMDEKRLNCPLCINTFGYSFGLECHLLSSHAEELQQIRMGKLSLKNADNLHGCLCCAAQFVRVEILVKHILEEHKDFLLSSLHGKEFADFDNDHHSSDPHQSLRRHFDCQFCGQKFLRRHQKLFLVHLEQKHLRDLELHMQECDMLLMHHPIENVEIKLLQNLSSKCRVTRVSTPCSAAPKRRSVSAQRVKNDLNFYEKLNTPEHHVYAVIESPQPTPQNLSNTMKKLKKKVLKKSDSLKENPKFPNYKIPTAVKKPLKKSYSAGGSQQNTMILMPKSRTYRSIPQPEPPPNLNSEEDEERRTTSTYSSSSGNSSGFHFPGNLFKCNLCEIAFAENAFLLTHLKNRHRSTMTKALRPHFSCGACPAKFFKNSFLVKHVEFHCLENQRLR